LFSKELLAELKSRVNCVELVLSWGHRVNKNLTTCVKPQNHKHNDANPSMLVSPQGFKCLNPACGIQGDAISLVGEKLGLDFEKSVVLLANFVGLTITSPTSPIPRISPVQTKTTTDKSGKVVERKPKGEGQHVKVDQLEYLPEVIETLKEAPNYAKFCQEAYIQFINSKEAQDYIQSRGISLETAKKCLLGYADGKIVIPYIVNGKIIYYSSRSIGQEKVFYQPSGTVPCPIGFDILKGTRIVYIAEGLFDYLSLVEKGFPAIGVPGAAGWKSSREWNSLLLGHKVMLCFHADEGGIKANHFLERICQGLSVPYEIIDWSVTAGTDIKDINEYILSGGDINKLFHRTTIPNLDNIKTELSTLINLSDYPNAIDLCIATVVSNVMQGDPVWILFVGPPSVGKTEIIRAVNNAVSTYFINRISPNTLISGFTKVEYADVITRIIKPTTFCITDFGSFLAFHPQDMQKIMQQLRDVYDGKVHVEYGNGKIVDWSGKVGIIGGITPEIERHSAFIGRLGDRFLYYRMSISEDKRMQIAFNAIMFPSLEDDIRKKIASATSKFIDDCIMRIKEAETVKITEDVAMIVSAASDFLSRARTPVARMHDMVKTIEYKPEYEATGRIARAFKVLIKALAFVRGRNEATYEDYLVIKDICRGSIPSIREQFIRAAYKHRDRWVGTSEFGNMLGKDTPSARYHLSNLLAIGILDINQISKNENRWRIKDDASNLITTSKFFE